jgi:hypothetical protein
VGELAGLLPNRLDHGGCGVADVDHRDAGPEVDQRVAVDVDQHPTAAAGDEHWQHDAYPASDRVLAAGEQGLRPRSGDGGDQAALLRKLRSWAGIGSGLDVVDHATLTVFR